MYLELADLPKIINTKLDQGEDRLTQTLVFPKFSYIYRNTWCLNLLKNIMMESTDQNKGERTTQSQR